MARMGRIKSYALQLVTNLRGWKTPRNLVVFESDDWGAIRMPGRKAWERMRAAGIRVDQSRYDSLDCLETSDDFQALMNVIDNHRDDSGRPVIFTLNTVMGNPDFSAIENDGFRRFHHQHLFDSYRHYHGENLENDWLDAMQSGLIRPQFHGREHVNVPLWMRDLQAGHDETRFAFDLGFYSLTTKTSSPRQKNYLAAFWAESPEELQSVIDRLKEGLFMFKKAFGYSSRTFISCNYVLPTQAESILRESGVELLQSQRGQFVPNGFDHGGWIVRVFTGKRSAAGLLRSVRNVMFEPFEDASKEWVSSALGQIQQSFDWRKPAIISSHRVNYVSGMSLEHRDRSLKMLDKLLREIRIRWPEVEFISSDRLLDEMITV